MLCLVQITLQLIHSATLLAVHVALLPNHPSWSLENVCTNAQRAIILCIITWHIVRATIPTTVMLAVQDTLQLMAPNKKTRPRRFVCPPKCKNSRYWRRVRNSARRSQRQLLCKLIMMLLRTHKRLYRLEVCLHTNSRMEQIQTLHTLMQTQSAGTIIRQCVETQLRGLYNLVKHLIPKNWTARNVSHTDMNNKMPQKGGGSKSKKADHDQNTDQNNMYNPFSRCGTEWLDSSQIQLSSLYLLHTQYVHAKHQNMWGATHTTVTNTHLIHQLRLAGRNNDLKDTVGIAQLLRDTFDRKGPCPAIVLGDGVTSRQYLSIPKQNPSL